MMWLRSHEHLNTLLDEIASDLEHLGFETGCRSYDICEDGYCMYIQERCPCRTDTGFDTFMFTVDKYEEDYYVRQNIRNLFEKHLEEDKRTA